MPFFVLFSKFDFLLFSSFFPSFFYVLQEENWSRESTIVRTAAKLRPRIEIVAIKCPVCLNQVPENGIRSVSNPLNSIFFSVELFYNYENCLLPVT